MICQPIPVVWLTCESVYGFCKVKLQDARESCWGTVLVGCDGELDFYYGPNGEFDYQVINSRRGLVEGVEVDAELADILPSSSRGRAASSPSFSLEDGVTEGVTSSSLRGGAKGPKGIIS
jgi:hypothetical protein